MSDQIYNIVVLGNTGVGKSSLLNFLSNNKNAFPEGDTAISVTSKAQFNVSKWLGDDKNKTVRFCDTQGLSDSRGIDTENIKQMIATIKELEYVDMFLICFNGDEPRFSDYTKSTIQLFIDMFGADVLNHVALVFNKWYGQVKTLKEETRRRTEFQKIIEEYFDKKEVPCYFIDSQCNLKLKRPDPLTGEETECELPPKIKDKTYSQLIVLYAFLITKGIRCDVRNAVPKKTEVEELKSRALESEEKLKLMGEEVKQLVLQVKNAEAKAIAAQKKAESEIMKLNAERDKIVAEAIAEAERKIKATVEKRALEMEQYNREFAKQKEEEVKLLVLMANNAEAKAIAVQKQVELDIVRLKNTERENAEASAIAENERKMREAAEKRALEVEQYNRELAKQKEEEIHQLVLMARNAEEKAIAAQKQAELDILRLNDERDEAEANAIAETERKMREAAAKQAQEMQKHYVDLTNQKEQLMKEKQTNAQLANEKINKLVAEQEKQKQDYIKSKNEIENSYKKDLELEKSKICLIL